MSWKESTDERIERTLRDLARTAQTLLRRCQAIQEIGEGYDPMSPLMTRARGASRHLQDVVQSLSPMMLDGGVGQMKITRETLGSNERVVVRCVSSLIDGLELRSGQNDDDVDPEKRGPRKGLQGFSWSVDVSEILSFLASFNKSGTLEVSTFDETFRLGLHDGQIVFATSDSSPPGNRLGDILIEIEAIDVRTLDAFMDSNQSRQRIGEALVQDELVTREHLRAALELQTQRLFGRLFAATDATFSFFEERDIPMHTVQMNVAQLLLESAEKSDQDHRAA